MKKFNLSVVACGLLASTLVANASSLEDAFKNGKASGEISAYTTSTNSNGADTGYSITSVSLNYETASVMGVKASLGFITNHLIDEETAADFDETTPNVVMTTANLGYANDMFSLTVGRQAIDLEWISDYHEAVVAAVTAIPNVTLIAGYTNKFNTSANDGALEEFQDVGTKGAYVVDATVAAGPVTVGAYYMDAPDLFSAYGAKVEASMSGVAIVAKYATTSEDVAGTKDGAIMAIDAGYSNDMFGVNAGYITTDKDGAIGNLAALGDNINPFDDEISVYGTDASTYYANVTASVAGFDLGMLYGSTNIGSVDDTELDISATWECKLVKNMNISLLYVDQNNESTADKSYYSAQVAYTF